MNVFVVAMSAPAAKYSPWMRAISVGLRQVEQVRVAGQVVAVVAEPLAAVALLPAHLALQEHAPRAVEDGDALPEDRFEPFSRVLHLRSLQQARERCSRAL